MELAQAHPVGSYEYGCHLSWIAIMNEAFRFDLR